MKKLIFPFFIFRKILLLAVFLFVMCFAQGQSCNDPSPPGSSCSTAPILCQEDLDGYCSTNPSTPNPDTFNGCFTQATNVQWLGFVAGSPFLQFTITVTNCQGSENPPGGGIQAVIIRADSCQPPYTFKSNCYSNGTPNATAILTTNTALIRGRVYYLVLDGWSFDVCDWSVEITGGSASPPPLNPPDITGIETPNSGCVYTYSIPANTEATNFTWTVEGPGIITSPSSGSEAHNISVEWLGEGTGEICVTAEALCNDTVTSCLNVDISSSPTMVSGQITNATCGDCNGSIFVSASGGSEPYLYSWSNGGTNNLLTNLCPDSYILEVSDTSGCTISDTFIVEQVGNTPVLVDINVESASDCNISCDGSIDITVDQGNSPYTLEWSGPDGFTSSEEDISGLCPGMYSLLAQDTAGCLLDTTVEVPCPLEILVDDVTIGDNSCFGSCEGSISVPVAGGRPPYAFVWSNGDTTQTLIQLCTGEYQVTVSDEAGSSDSAAFVVLEPDELVLEFTGGTSSCNSDGAMAADVNGGSESYLFKWFTKTDSLVKSSPDSFVTGLDPGVYFLNVVDSVGCSILDSFEIAANLQVEVTSTYVDCDNANGTASVEIIAGAGHPVFKWSNGAVGSTQHNLSAGWYSVTVSDSLSSCQTHENVQVPYDTGCYFLISGYILDDEQSQSCQFDSTVTGIPNVLVTLNGLPNNDQITFTDSSGYYEFKVFEGPGIYLVQSTINNPLYEKECAEALKIVAIDDQEDFPENNFYYKHFENKNLAIAVFTPFVRPGFTQEVRIWVWNYGDESSNATVWMQHDSLQEFESAIPVESEHLPDSQKIVWELGAIPAGGLRVMQCHLFLPQAVPLLTPIQQTYQALPVAGDISPWDNFELINLVVTGAKDLKDKQVFPGGKGPDGKITPQDSILQYAIRFQNTGIDTAITVVIRDTLDENLNVKSIRPLAASHPYRLDFKNDRVLEVWFENVMLPDSSLNPETSRGFIFFEIKINPDLLPGIKIQNSAGIYFDFNSPVVTNMVVNTISDIVNTYTVSISKIDLKVFPNPSPGNISVRYELGEKEEVELSILDIRGEIVKTLISARKQNQGIHDYSWNKINLPAGTYFVYLRSKKRVLAIQKVVLK